MVRREKQRYNFTLSDDVKERLEQYAYENHMSMSAAVTQLILCAKVKNSQIKGQMTIKQEK